MTTGRDAASPTNDVPPESAGVPLAPATLPKRPSLLGTLLRIVLVIVGVLVILGTVLFLVVAISLNNMGKAPTSTDAAVAWRSTTVQLADDQPSVRGHTTLSAPSVPATGVQVGVNVGVPTSDATGPAALLAGPVVRLSAHAVGDTREPVSCVAPCELTLPQAFDCSGDGCRMGIDVTLELLPAAAADVRHVTVDVSAGITGNPAHPLPTSFTVDFGLATPPPQPSGGG
ncbi:MAG TPA: hypothetical protein VJ850_08135 [Candidatus Limnocylindrales bacterium]|nr:hypothetical protein [Candidatus Limnocylindrales bacterium]